MDKVQVEASGSGVATNLQEVEIDGKSLSLAPLSLDDPKAALCLDEHSPGAARQPAIGPAFAVLAFGSGIFLLRTARTRDVGEQDHSIRVRPTVLRPTPRAYSRSETEALLRVPWRPGGPTTFGGHRCPPSPPANAASPTVTAGQRSVAEPDSSSSSDVVDGPEPGEEALAASLDRARQETQEITRIRNDFLARLELLHRNSSGRIDTMGKQQGAADAPRD